MTGMTDKTSHLLSKIGITIGKGNKLELDEDELKKADISSLKTVFTGYNSFAGKTAQKAAGILNAANREVRLIQTMVHIRKEILL